VFRKVLVANRGEIAVRILRALRELGIPSVAVYSQVDRAALHVRMADEAAAIGPAESAKSYLDMDRILTAARDHGADAIHPGYGFLSENAEFAAACETAGIVFIGPPSSAIRAMGLKTDARRLAESVGVPVVPGEGEPVTSLDQAHRAATAAGYPVMLKAAAGGGGKGMRRVDNQEAMAASLRDASSEAERAFRNPAVYVEKLIEEPRHIEVQILGDRNGHLIHLGERECSIQRRHQKLIEESPSPLVAAHPELRERLGDAALRVARAAGYSNAGTVEFLLDRGHNFYFLEMNTRLQVEHAVTEAVTGLDLVHWQLRIAAGEPLTLRQSDIAWRGAAIECRICAEDPDRDFLPSPGKITQIDRPSGPGVRVDSGVYAGWTVPIEYDPLLAKVIVHAADRPAAIVRMVSALSEYFVAGIRTNLSFFRQILEDEQFQQGRLHTGFIHEFHQRRQPVDGDCEQARAREAVAALVAAIHAGKQQAGPSGAGAEVNAWRTQGRRRLME
jgi:acetyl-CoA carboxylase biotin carboxylase subunit